MNFKLGKKYIVEVTEKGIIPIDEFLEERYFNKDLDDIEFLTNEEKVIVVTKALFELKNIVAFKANSIEPNNDYLRGRLEALRGVLSNIRELIEDIKENK